MVRGIATISTVLLTTASGCGVAGMANASPAADQPTDVCAFTLSTPQRVQVSGVDMVTATASAYPCAGEAIPTKVEACVQLQGSGGPKQCEQQATMDQPVQVYFSPYRAGATYTSHGTGCIGLFKAPYSACQSLGPKSATL
jgi:hypothetical protein